MFQLNYKFLLISFGVLFEFLYQYSLNRSIVFDLNRFFTASFRRQIQVIVIILAMGCILLSFFNQNMVSTYLRPLNLTKYLDINFQIPYYIYLPLFLLLSGLFNVNSVSITEHGIRAPRVKKGIITWGQIESIQYEDEPETNQIILNIEYITRDPTDYDNKVIRFDSSDKYEIQNYLNQKKDQFDQEDSLPFAPLRIMRIAALCILIPGELLLMLFTDLVI